MKKVIALALALMMALCLCACGKTQTGPGPAQNAELDMTAFYEDTMEKYEFPGMVLAEGDMLEMFYPGLSALDGVAEFQVYTPMMTGAPSELTLVKLSDPSAAGAVKAVFDARVAACTEEGMNYPDTIDAWVNNCRQVTVGNYMMLVVHTDCDAIQADFEAALQK